MNDPLMNRNVPADLLQTLNSFNQLHLVQFWDSLTAEQQQQLANQIRSIDFELIQTTLRKGLEQTDSEPQANRADAAKAPASVVRQPSSDADSAEWKRAAQLGEQLLKEGQVGVITVAGGQGSRLGFEHPKGLYPIGPISERSLFQIFAEQILARNRRHETSILWMIMTSDATHSETVQFFQTQNFFGLNPNRVVFFQQGCMPAVDASTGKVLLESTSAVCLSPDGHGGLVSGLSNAGLLNRMKDEGIQHVFYHQVDNPTVILCDPAFTGFHADHQSSLSTNVVRKASPTERMGVLVEVDGQTQIIEYSELTPTQAAKEDETGQWIFWAGNTAIHMFSRQFLETLAEEGCRLPLHLAKKRVACIDENGKPAPPVGSSELNGIKFERFIFDALPLAPKTLIVEGNRDREFNPVKNGQGADSPATARSALSRIGRQWLKTAGFDLADETPVEISPLIALDSDELSDAIKSGTCSLEQLLGKN